MNMGLLHIAARVAAHKYHLAGHQEVLLYTDQVFDKYGIYPPNMREIAPFDQATFEGMVYEGINLNIEGTELEELKIWLNNKPMGSMDEAAELSKKLRKETGLEIQIAPATGNVDGIDYDLQKYNFDHKNNTEEIEISWKTGPNKIELSVNTTMSGGTNFNALRVNGADVTNLAKDGNWNDAMAHYDFLGAKPPDPAAWVTEYIFTPTSKAFEDSADQSAKDIERWDTGSGHFFDWIHREGYSIVDGKVLLRDEDEDDVEVIKAVGGP